MRPGPYLHLIEAVFLVAYFLIYLPIAEGTRKLCGIFFFLIRAKILFMRAAPSWSNHFLNDSPPNTISLAFGTKYMNVKETQTFRPWHFYYFYSFRLRFMIQNMICSNKILCVIERNVFYSCWIIHLKRLFRSN